jgi:hypothetical protein
MNLPTYESRLAPEAAWAGIVGSLTVVVGLVMAEIGASTELTVAVTGLIGGVSRLALGYLLPSPPLPEP